MPTLAEILAKKKPVAPLPPKSPGLTITPEAERAAAATEIKASLDAMAPKIPPPTPRELGAMERGERVPMDHPPVDGTADDLAWFSASHAFDSSIGIVMEPHESGSHAWIACQPNPHRQPILLFRLPLLSRKRRAGDPF